MTALPPATIRKTAARLNPRDVVHVVRVSHTDNHLLNWLGRRDDIEVKTVATVDKDPSDRRGLLVTYTDGTHSREARNVKARLVSDAQEEATRSAAREAKAQRAAANAETEAATRAPETAPATPTGDVVTVPVPVRLFHHLGDQGYADDAISERRRDLFAALADSPRRQVKRVWTISAELPELLASTLFDAMLDLWELRRSGASDLRRAALVVLRDLQAAGVRRTERIPTTTAANPVVSGTESLRRLLQL